MIINQVVAGGGTTPTGTIQITTNGTHDVTNYATADVNVPTTAPALYREFQLDNTGELQINTTTTHIMDFTGVKSFAPYVLQRAYYNNTAISGVLDMSDLITASGISACTAAFYGCTGLTGINLSSLTAVTGNSCCDSMFYGCTGITSANLPALTTISGTNACQRMFNNCTGLISVNLGALTEVPSGQSACTGMFESCTGLTSADLDSLTTLNGTQYACSNMFKGCTALVSVKLNSLTTLTGTYACQNMFSGCLNLTSLSFPSITTNSFGARTNQFGSLCQGIPSITLHFPSNVQSNVEAMSGYSTTAPFGATAGTVLFDLPATYTLTGADSVTYTRNPKYDTATSLAWKVGAYGTTDFTPAYYTSGTTDPTVGTTIYSDAACTQSVTTITAIA